MRAIDYFDKGAEAFPIAPRSSIGTQDILIVRCALLPSASHGLCGQAACNREERVAIYSPNDARVLFCMLGLMRAGGVWVPINYRNALDANVEYMKYVETSWLFYHSSFSEDGEGDPEAGAVFAASRVHRRGRRRESFAGSIHEARGRREEIDWGDARGNLDRLVGLVPTGGTTGPAKGVMVTSLAWGTMTEMASHYWRGEGSNRCA